MCLSRLLSVTLFSVTGDSGLLKVTEIGTGETKARGKNITPEGWGHANGQKQWGRGDRATKLLPKAPIFPEFQVRLTRMKQELLFLSGPVNLDRIVSHGHTLTEHSQSS